jgi:tetratricopeptide (TPR) repeat protein
MSANEDSLQKGKNLYNEGKLTEALQQFELLIRSDTSNTEAKKLAGVTYLRLQQYDKAIPYFEQLERVSLYSNSGKFYHALTLMKRNLPGDDQKARLLLQEVVENDLHEKETAKEWLDKKW